MDDVRAVMDAAGSERAALVGISEGVPMSILFAATYPHGSGPWSAPEGWRAPPTPRTTPGEPRLKP